jgi:hypothetical protein
MTEHMQAITPDDRDRYRLQVNLAQWLTETGSSATADGAMFEVEKVPPGHGIRMLCVTATLTDGQVATALLDLTIDYRVTPRDAAFDAPMRTWPWSWR